MTEVDTGVDDGDDGAGTAAARPGLLGVDLVQPVELVAQRVVGGGTGLTGGDDEADRAGSGGEGGGPGLHRGVLRQGTLVTQR
ncbi:hypothetical protein [Janibacter indicus]|uniref:hypothetical protein n=1 Tax=Janibacter indicus TaxID=857417 RepID=UPI001CF1955A|nr:hypothetical protein [Janibacter indicus]